MSRDYKTYWRALLFISTFRLIWWNEICSSKIRPINISRILFAVESDQRKSDSSLIDHLVLVLNREFFKILIFSDRTKETFGFYVSELENDFGSY